MRNFIRLLAFLLSLAMLFAFTACGYREVRSSKEDRATVLTVDGERFEVAYELYRFLFMTQKDIYYPSYAVNDWSAAKKVEYFKKFDAFARKEIVRIYALFSLCESYGIDPYSREVDKAVKEAFVDAIENEQSGFGSHSAYLKAIEKEHMTDSVFRLYLRYDACEKLLATAMHEAEFVQEDKDTVLSYYESDEAIRATWIYIPYSSLGYDPQVGFTAEMDDHLESVWLDAKAADDALFLTYTHTRTIQGLYTDAELDTGFYFGKYQLDDYYQALSEAAFALEVGETSGLVHSGDGIYIIRRLPKDNGYLNKEENLAYLRECYLLNEFYRALAKEADRLLTTLETNELYDTLTVDSIQ